ncbi:hypothetical protein [Kitasatospora cinereorecta]|uniref:Uncharacterized protein n=1 Tax=Kitasatospora cinereorecta TaxID=285560 RepID=A0ABW0V8V8_9ACTN
MGELLSDLINLAVVLLHELPSVLWWLDHAVMLLRCRWAARTGAVRESRARRRAARRLPSGGGPVDDDPGA